MPATDELTFSGTFVDLKGVPISGTAAIHYTFLGDPPSNCGTVFDLEDADGRTDATGGFRLTLPGLDELLSRKGPSGVWRRGCFFIFAVKDSRTMAYAIASGDELQGNRVDLPVLSQFDMHGQVVDEAGAPIAGAKIGIDRYTLFVGRGPCPSTPVNFWLSQRQERVADLVAYTDAEGHFAIRDVPAMPQLQMTVSHCSYAALETPYFAHQPTCRLILEPAAEVLVQICLPDGSAACGFELFLEGVPIDAHSATHRSGITDAAGRCKLDGLPAGDYVIRFLGGTQERWAIPAIDVSDLAKGERRQVTACAIAGSVLCGRVLDAESKAPSFHAEVRFSSEDYPGTASTFQAAYTDRDGYFIFRYAVVPGVLDVCVTVLHNGHWIGERCKILVQNEPKTEMEFRLRLGLA